MTKEKKENIPSALKGAFDELEKLNADSCTLSENALSVVDKFIDTGSMALNAIISGSLYKGVPAGRITGFAGPTGCGKSMIISKIIANAQAKDPEVWGVIWDSENAFDINMARNMGANVNKIKHNPVDTVEDCRNQITKFLDKIAEDPSLHGKCVIAIDSLGNLASTKEMKDAAEGKDAADMGLRAKTIKSMMRILTGKCARTNTTLIFSNHIYANPTQMFPSLVQNQGGGNGPLYLASVLVQLGVRQEKRDTQKEKEEFIPIANKVKGVNMRALTVKNRFVPPFLETELYLNFKSGLYKYAGLLEMATAYGIIIQNGPSYTLADGTKIGYESSFRDDPVFWDKILPVLDKTLQEKLAFSSAVQDEAVKNDE